VNPTVSLPKRKALIWANRTLRVKDCYWGAVAHFVGSGAFVFYRILGLRSQSLAPPQAICGHLLRRLLAGTAPQVYPPWNCSAGYWQELRRRFTRHGPAPQVSRCFPLRRFEPWGGQDGPPLQLRHP